MKANQHHELEMERMDTLQTNMSNYRGDILLDEADVSGEKNDDGSVVSIL